MTEIELMRTIVRDALWQLKYHEEQLLKGNKERAAAKLLLARAQVDFSEQDAIDYYLEHDEDETFNTPTEAFKCILGEHLNANVYHEQELMKAHAQMAATKALLARTNFTEKEVSIEKVKQEMKK